MLAFYSLLSDLSCLTRGVHDSSSWTQKFCPQRPSSSLTLSAHSWNRTLANCQLSAPQRSAVANRHAYLHGIGESNPNALQSSISCCTIDIVVSSLQYSCFPASLRVTLG